MSDNISLKYLFDQQNLNARKTRWLAFLSEYDFEIKHIKGKENKVVDALRRNANINFIVVFSNYKIELDDKFEDRIKIDKNYQNLRENVTENEDENVKIDLILNEKGINVV